MASLSSLFSLLLPLLATLVIPTTCHGTLPENYVAFFIFGDSLFDAGNNNYLVDVPHTNVPPYGESFFSDPTGRPSDGCLIPDFIAQRANLPFISPYLRPGFHDYTNGVNFASAGSGVLFETSPTAIDLKSQLENFERVVETLTLQLGDDEAKKLLSNAVYLFSIGGNDYMNLVDNQPTGLTPSYKLTFILMVLGNFTTVLKEVYNSGGRKFAIQNVGPLGCSPSSKAKAPRNSTLTDDCVEELQTLAIQHNTLQSTLLESLATQLSDFKYSLFDYFTSLMERTLDSSKFGFQVGDSACCGSGLYNGNMTCGHNETGSYNLCSDPCEYVWFDPAHPTQRTFKQLADLFWTGNLSVTRPYNLSTLFKMSSSSVETL